MGQPSPVTLGRLANLPLVNLFAISGLSHAFSARADISQSGLCKMQKLVALLALLLCKGRKPLQSLYLYHLANRATVALFGPVCGPVTRRTGAEVSSHNLSRAMQ
jgi:hypothetical protein